MNLISPEYLKLNAELHSRIPEYGTHGHFHAPEIVTFANAIGTRTILDYGCGRATLANALGERVVNYDPAIPEYSNPPEPADLVTCCDVLEHCEPELLDNVLDHIQSLALKGVFLVIALHPAKKTLADGRNAHLIQQPPEWWMPKLMSRWHLSGCAAPLMKLKFAGVAR